LISLMVQFLINTFYGSDPKAYFIFRAIALSLISLKSSGTNIGFVNITVTFPFFPMLLIYAFPADVSIGGIPFGV